MNVLILGRGYIGSHLYRVMCRNGNIRHTHIVSKDRVDYTNAVMLQKYIKEHTINAVVNASGFTGRPNVDQCETHKRDCWYYNVVVPCIMRDVCANLDVDFYHVSSGCIYTGYDKLWTEEDVPNFGLYDASSFYSKTKHACETLISPYNDTRVLRIRMPFSRDKTDRNFICKLTKYDKLISYKNSMTCVEDFCVILSKMILERAPVGVYNMVHSEPLSAEDIVSLFPGDKKYNFVSIEQLGLAAPRSNCVMSDQKISKMGYAFPCVKQSMSSCVSHVFERA